MCSGHRSASWKRKTVAFQRRSLRRVNERVAGGGRNRDDRTARAAVPVWPPEKHVAIRTLRTEFSAGPIRAAARVRKPWEIVRANATASFRAEFSCAVEWENRDRRRPSSRATIPRGRAQTTGPRATLHVVAPFGNNGQSGCLVQQRATTVRSRYSVLAGRYYCIVRDVLVTFQLGKETEEREGPLRRVRFNIKYLRLIRISTSKSAVSRPAAKTSDGSVII